VAWGAPGWAAAGSSGAVLWSPDGSAWARATGRTQQAFTALNWDGTRFTLANDAGQIFASSDGRTWSSERSRTALWLRGLASSAGMRAAVGDAGAVSTSVCTLEPRVRRRLFRSP
jgi:hypothetical protein